MERPVPHPDRPPLRKGRAFAIGLLFGIVAFAIGFYGSGALGLGEPLRYVTGAAIAGVGTLVLVRQVNRRSATSRPGAASREPDSR